MSPPSVMRMAYWAPDHAMDPAQEDVLDAPDRFRKVLVGFVDRA